MMNVTILNNDDGTARLVTISFSSWLSETVGIATLAAYAQKHPTAWIAVSSEASCWYGGNKTVAAELTEWYQNNQKSVT